MRVPGWRLGLHRLQVLFGLLGRKAEQVLRQQMFFIRRLYRLLLFSYIYPSMFEPAGIT